jgi:hypothetical protein
MPNESTMDEKSKLLFALQQVEGISKLMKGNEYESFIVSNLIPIRVELHRQLTNPTQSSKIKE